MKPLPLGSSLVLALVSLTCTQTSPTTPQDRATATGSTALSASSAAATRRGVARTVDPRRSSTARLLGEWGGDRLALTITETGGRLQYDCAHGSVDQAFVVDSAGRFDLVGTHFREHGGPVTENEQPDAHPARYTGSTDGRTMTLTVRLTDLNESIGTFRLRFGEVPRIVRCL